MNIRSSLRKIKLDASTAAITALKVCGAVLMAVAVAGCGGGGSGSAAAPSGFTQTFTVSAAAGEVLQYSIDTTNMTYSYKVILSSYGIPLGKTGTGALSSKNAEGSYNIAASADNFIQGGVIFPIQNGLLAGHVQISTIGGAQKIPVFGMANPITAIANLADTYNYVSNKCTIPSGGNPAAGGAGCVSQYGTLKVTNTNPTTDAITICVNNDITANPACSTFTGTITATATPGVYNFIKAGAVNSGSFMAFTAPNGQKVAVVDFNDATLGATLYGQAVASTQATLISGGTDGNYFLKSNVGGGALITVTGTSFTDHTNFMPNGSTPVTGTITYNNPWTGVVSFSRTEGNTGVAIQAGTGAFAAMLTASPSFPGLSTYFYEVGLKY